MAWYDLKNLGRAALGVSTGGASELAIRGYEEASKDGNILGKAKVTPTPPADPSYFQLGAGNGSDLANQIAAQQAASGYDQQAAQADREGAFYNQANGNFDIANASQFRNGPQVTSSAADQQRQLAALQAANGGIANLNSSGNYMTALGKRPMGPSYAEAQLRQGQDTAMAQQLSMARSGRSLGSGAAAMNQAAFNNSALNQQTNQQAASARIQEQNNYNQFQLGALQGGANAYGQAGSLAGQAGNQASTIRGANDAIGNTNANLNLQQQQVNNQTTGLYNQLGQSQQQLGMQANQQGQIAQQFGANQAAGSLGSQLAANTSLGTANANITQNNVAAQNKATADKQNADRALVADGFKMAATASTSSDERVKTKIQPLEPEQTSDALPMVETNGMGMTVPAGTKKLNPMAAVLNRASQAVQKIQAATPPSAGQSYLDNIAALQAGSRDVQRGPVDVLNRVPGAGAGPSASQSALMERFAPRVFTPHNQPSTAPIRDIRKDSDFTRAIPTASPASFIRSDEHSKTKIQSLESQIAALTGGLGMRGTEYPTAKQPDTAGLDAANAKPPAVDFREARPYSYEYRDPSIPGAAPGRHVGPMAQDLLKSEATAPSVQDTPTGLQVDTPRLTMALSGAMSEQQRKTQELEQQLAALSGSNGGYQPAPFDPSLYAAPRGSY